MLGKLGIKQFAKRRFERLYSTYLISGHRFLRLVGFSTAGVARPLLEEVYITLRVRAHGTNFVERNRQGENGQTINFNDAVHRYGKLVILGAPGAGKTTTLSFIILRLLRNQGAQIFDLPGKYIPIFIPLRRLANTLTTILDDLLEPKTQILPQEILSECPKHYFEELLRAGRCFVLFDGLDEVTSTEAHKSSAEKIQSFVAAYPRNRFIVTCRIAGWLNLLPDFQVLEADDLSREEVHRFVRGWHSAVIGLQERNRIEQEHDRREDRIRAMQESAPKLRVAVDDYSRRLNNAIDSSARILAIATNPMLLSLICLVHLIKSILPKGRPILYAQCIELLIDAWDRGRGFLIAPSQITWQQKEAILRHIAYEFQLSGKGEAPRSDLVKLVDRIRKRLLVETVADELINDIVLRSGLLVERSIEVLGFSHLTLQEYLTARHYQLYRELLPELFGHAGVREWREVILLYSGSIDDSTPVVAEILKIQNLQGEVLAAGCIGEAQTVDETVVDETIQRMLSRLKATEDAVEIEALIEGLAAVASDFTSPDNQTLRQKLSAQLIASVKANDHEASAATMILGKARITKALPELVEAFFGNAKLRSSANKALVLFGNLAVDAIEKAVNVVKSLPDIQMLLEPLAAINTGSSALAIARLYGRYNDRKDSQMISETLATMICQPLIEAEICQVSESELKVGMGHELVRREDNKWYSGPRDASAEYISLIYRVQNDLSAFFVSRASAKDEEEAGSFIRFNFALAFPAFVDAIKKLSGRAPAWMFLKLGFADPVSRNLSMGFDQLARAIGNEESDLSTILKQSRRRMEVKGSSLGNSGVRNIVSGIISIIYLFNIFMCGIAVFPWTGGGSPLSELRPAVIFWISCVSMFIYVAIIAGRLAEKRGGLLYAFFTAVFTPVQNLLRKIFRIWPRHAWVGFAIVMVVICGTSVAGAILVYFASQLDESNTIYQALSVPMLGIVSVFVTMCAVYYYKYVLRVSASTILLSLHSKGAEMTSVV